MLLIWKKTVLFILFLNHVITWKNIELFIIFPKWVFLLSYKFIKNSTLNFFIDSQ